MERNPQLRSRKFFRATLATADPDKIQEMLAIMDKNRDAIETDIGTLVFYMQGGIDYNDAWLLTSSQRTKMAKIIERHYENMNGSKKQML